MSPLVFLAIPVVITVVWLLVTSARTRRPTGLSASIDDFRREMQALAPDTDQPGG